MRRRYRGGVELTDRQFSEQPWTYGMLQFSEGILFLVEGPKDANQEPYGRLYRPVLKACYSDTISFSGIEQHGKLWVAQVWFCEVGQRMPGDHMKLRDGTAVLKPLEERLPPGLYTPPKERPHKAG